MEQIAEEILLDHRKNGHQMFLITSSIAGEGVTKVCRQLSDTISRMHSGKIFLFEVPKDDTDLVPSDDPASQELFKQLKKEYSIIIMDAGGLMKREGALSYLDRADACILVVRAGLTPRPILRESIERLRRNQVCILGTILNDRQSLIPRFIQRFLG